jgi:Ankyrin repeats (3 copies)
MRRLSKILLIMTLANFCQCQSVTKQDDSYSTFPKASKTNEISDAPQIIRQSDLEIQLIKGVKEKNKTEVVELLKKGVSPDTAEWLKDSSLRYEFVGTTVLTIAVSNKDIHIAEILLKNKANVNIAAARGNTDKAGHISVNDAEWLSSPLASAAVNNDIPMIMLLAHYKIDVEKANSNGDLYKIASEEKTIKALKEIGVDINRIDETNEMTALMEAVRYDNYEKVKLLTKYGADVNVRTRNGCNIWGFLAEDKDEKISKLLKKLGAKNREDQCVENTNNLDK